MTLRSNHTGQSRAHLTKLHGVILEAFPVLIIQMVVPLRLVETIGFDANVSVHKHKFSLSLGVSLFTMYRGARFPQFC